MNRGFGINGRPPFMIAMKTRISSLGTKPASMRQRPSGEGRAQATPGTGAPGERLHQRTRLPESPLERSRQGREPPQIPSAGQGGAPVSRPRATLGLCQGALSWLGQERPPRLRHAGSDQSQPMVETSDGRSASRVAKTGGKSPFSPPPKANSCVARHPGPNVSPALKRSSFSSRLPV